MEILFVLGRNPKLSYAEVLSYLQSHYIPYSVNLFKQNFLIVEVVDGTKIDIQEFGGVLKMADVNSFESEKDFDKYLSKYFVEDQKFSFSVLGSADEEIEDKLMKRFKEEKAKAQIRHGKARLKLQEGDQIEMTNADVEFFYFKDEKKVYFAKIRQDYSYVEVKDRDMNKPFRREELAISPRLAKILVNLSQTKKGQLLVDPFCGIGGIMQEALLKGINCFGIDIEKDAISGAKKNLLWLDKKYKLNAQYKLMNADSRDLANINIDGVATETALGELVKRKLMDKEANQYVQNFLRMIIPILKTIKQLKTKEARIVLTMPYIRQFSVNFEEICKYTGLKVANIEGIEMPIKEFRDDQYVSRDIIVFE